MFYYKHHFFKIQVSHSTPLVGMKPIWSFQQLKLETLVFFFSFWYWNSSLETLRVRYWYMKWRWILSHSLSKTRYSNKKNTTLWFTFQLTSAKLSLSSKNCKGTSECSISSNILFPKITIKRKTDCSIYQTGSPNADMFIILLLSEILCCLKSDAIEATYTKVKRLKTWSTFSEIMNTNKFLGCQKYCIDNDNKT